MRKFTKIISVCLIFTLLFTLAACGNSTNQTNGNAEYITITDHNDNEVKLVKNPQRAVVCSCWPLASVLTIFFNSADFLVGMPPECMTAAENGLLGELYPEILNIETSFIKGGEVNIEELLKLEPDVVFYQANQPSLGEKLVNAGLPAVAVSVDKWNYGAIETLDNWIKLLSEIWPDNDRSQLVHDKSYEIYDLIQTRTANLTDEERAKVFFLFNYSETTLTTSAKNHFGQWWADAIGAVNVASEITDANSIAVNMEQIYTWNPEIIFITNFTTAQADDLYNNTIGNYDWSVVDAVKTQNVYKMPLGMYRSFTPGVDTPLTLLWMAQAAYPELFSDIDINQEVKNYYKEIFNVELTDEQVAQIFTPSSLAAGV